MTNSIQEVQKELIEEFEFFDDWTDRYQYLIDLGRQLPSFPEEKRTETYKLHGCQSQVWFFHNRKDDYIEYNAISDSAIVSGLIALLLRVYSNRTADEIIHTEPEFIRAIGLTAHLSPTRKNGLHAMLTKIKSIAQQEIHSNAK